ncbi:MAG: MFS transporter [Actinomycetota bacterium]
METTIKRPDKGAPKARLITPVFVLITLSTFAYFVSIGTLLPTLPRYVEGPLGGGSVSVGLAIGSFALAAVALRPFIGRVGDRRGRRILMIGGAFVVGVSIALYPVATSLVPLLLLRLLTGAGEAAFYVGAASAINDLAPDERRGEALSYFSLALYSGLAVGPVIGELLLDGSHFTTVYLASAASAGLAAAIGLRVPDTRPQELSNDPPESHTIIHRAGLMPGTILATSIWGLSGFSTFIPLYALDIGMDGSKLVFALYSGVVLAIRSFGARLPDVLGPRTAGTAALSCSTVGLATIAAWSEPAGIFVGAAVFGVGQALAFPALMTLAISGTKTSERGAVVGTFTAFFDLAFGLGALSLGAVAALLGYRGLFISAAAVSLSGIVLLHFYARRARVRREIAEARGPEWA